MADIVLKIGDIPPGTMKAIDLGGEEVVIANVGGTCFAFGGLCTHEDAPLADGSLDGTTVTCPWHGSRFDIRTGAVIDGFTDVPVPVFEVRTEGDSIRISKP